MLQGLGERRIGVNDYNLGRESSLAQGGGTATSTVALLQEASRRFDLYAKDIRRSLSEVGMQVLERLQQFQPVDRMYSVMGDNAEPVAAVLTLPVEANLREHLRVVTTSSASAANKEVARQNALTAFGVVSQYFEKLISLGGMMVNPEIPEPMRKLAYQMSEVGERLMGKILEGFDMNDIGAFLPPMEGMLNAGNTQPPMVPGGGGGGQDNGPEPGGGVAGPGSDVGDFAPTGTPGSGGPL